MRETRKKEIKNRVFSKKDICALWSRINQECKPVGGREYNSLIELTINCDDGTRYESSDSNLLNDGDIIDLKKCESLSISYHHSVLGRRVSVALKHGDYGSSLMVEGEDRDWVAGMFDQLNMILDSVKPRGHWFIKYKSVFLHMGALATGFIMIRFWAWLNGLGMPQEVSKEIKIHPPIRHVLTASLSWVLGVLPLAGLVSWVGKLWPSVEFDFGPEHLKVEKNRRIRLSLFFTTLAIPVIIWFITSGLFFQVLQKISF
ncbi:MAG: hypothetical protein U1A23_04895 [Candidatus Sungbacteria bacterium]|nr:hypothetical protein [bacterium]MDZ4286240.1 hypothetical protein [Candidatus Sungbacteria bacterium]